MPPNTQSTASELITSTSFINNFWSTNKTGMDSLLNYIKTTHDDLEAIQNVYSERSQIEQEYGQKLLVLSEKYGKGTDSSDVYQAIITELEKTAKSRIDFSEKLSGQVIMDLEQKLEEYKVLMEKWKLTLEEIFNEKQLRIMELLKIRARYLKEYEVSKGQSTSASESLKSQYKVMVADVDEVAQEWNTTWQEACEVMEAMEEDRIELIKGNVWEYANLGSSTLLVQDEWCENIRTKLEECSAEHEIKKCISMHATGSQMPSTNEYVNEIRNEQKRKSQAPSSKSHEAPKPPTKPQRHQSQISSTIPPNPPTNLSRQGSFNSDSYSSISSRDESTKTPKKHTMNQGQQSNIQTNASPDTAQTSSQCIGNGQFQSASKTPSINYKKSIDPKRENQIKNNISSNGGSTTARAPIRRKPLDKALMDQVSNEMAMARKQRDIERQMSVNDSIKKHVDNPITKGSQKSVENTSNDVDDSKSVSSDAAKSDSASYQHNMSVNGFKNTQRQPSEYKPDTGSIPVRRANTSHVSKDTTKSMNINTHTELQHEQLTHPIAAPKSPRPPPQQINDIQRNSSYEAAASSNDIHGFHSMQQAPVHQHYSGHQQYKGPQANTNHMQHTHQTAQLNYSSMAHQQRSPLMQPQASPMMQPQKSPMMQPSPLMQPQASPMIQPQASPMMQPQRSPLMHHQPSPMMGAPVSPMMQPLHSPVMAPTYVPTQNHQLPPPITMPPHNYIASPQPSPSMSYANPASPCFAPTSPAANFQQLPPRPTHYSDGRPILFWVRSKYDYEATDNEELSFRAYAAIGIVDGDMTQEAWWTGAVFDEYHQTWSNIGSVPSNFTEPDRPKYYDPRKKNAYY